MKGSNATTRVSESLPSSLKTAKLFRRVTSNTTNNAILISGQVVFSAHNAKPNQTPGRHYLMIHCMLQSPVPDKPAIETLAVGWADIQRFLQWCDIISHQDGLQPRSQRECLLPTFQLSVNGLFTFSECKRAVYNIFKRHLASCSSNVLLMKSGIGLSIPTPITRERITVVWLGSSQSPLELRCRSIPSLHQGVANFFFV